MRHEERLQRSLKGESVEIIFSFSPELIGFVQVHKKYDLKGSTVDREASEKEKLKKEPTLKVPSELIPLRVDMLVFAGQ